MTLHYKYVVRPPVIFSLQLGFLSQSFEVIGMVGGFNAGRILYDDTMYHHRLDSEHAAWTQIRLPKTCGRNSE